MPSSLYLILLAPICLFSILQLRALRQNAAAAKASGLPYVIVPFSIANPLSFALCAALKWIPKQWRGWWLDLLDSLDFTRGWHNGRRAFQLMGAETFLAVSPAGLVLHTCDADVSAHFLRGPAFGKPHELLGILNIYGPTMTGTDGAETRLYRRTTAPFFTDRTMRNVWAEGARGGSALMGLFAGRWDGEKGELRRDAGFWTERMRAVVARLTLHVVASVCFERRVEADEALGDVLRGEDAAPEGWELSFSRAMHGVLEWFTVIFVTPRLVLDYSPLQTHRNARQAYSQLGRYMEDLKVKREDQFRMGEKKKGSKESSSLLDLLVQAGVESPTPVLSPAEVLGNIFIFLFAGHEANANTLTFLFFLLACNPNAQRQAQQDIHKILPQLEKTNDIASCLSDPSLYDSAYPALMESHVGASINEALRLYTVLPWLVKTIPTQPQKEQTREQEGHAFAINGTPHRVPAGTMVLVNTTAAHTNAKYWPDKATQSKPYTSAYRTSPVDSFDLDRWLPSSTGADEDGAPVEKEKSRFFSPKPGSFIPFSDGSRGCLGKRFALVGLCAVVTRVLAEYSVELVAEDRSEWQELRDQAAKVLLDDIEFHMSLRLGGKVPVRFVKRGEEKVPWV